MRNAKFFNKNNIPLAWSNDFDNVEHLHDAIEDSTNDMSLGLSFTVDNREFLRGYLFALQENKEITRYEFLMLMKFYDRLVADKRFIAE